MTISLNITDLESLDKEVLTRTAKYLLDLAGHELVKAPQKKTPTHYKLPDDHKPWGEMPREGIPGVPVYEEEHTIKSEEFPNSNLDYLPGDIEESIHNQEILKAPIIPSEELNLKYDGDTLSQEIKDSLDSLGYVWNPDIHSRTKSKNADGTWKLKRGSVVPPVPAQTPVVSSIPVSPVIPTESVVIPMPPPVVDLFPIFMREISKDIADKKYSQSDVTTIAQRFGLKNIPAIATRPDLIPQIAVALGINNDILK